MLIVSARARHGTGKTFARSPAFPEDFCGGAARLHVLVSDAGFDDGPRDQLGSGAAAGSGGTIVRLRSRVRARAMPGAWLQVWVRMPQGPMPISNQIFATKDSIRIHVVPYLNQGQEVWLSYLLCAGAARAEFPHHVVGAAPHLAPANIILPPIENTSSVTVDAVPGAAVNVFAITGTPIKVELIGSGYVDPLVRHVGLTRLLTPKDVVYAEQWLAQATPGRRRSANGTAQRSTLQPRRSPVAAEYPERSQAGRPAHGQRHAARLIASSKGGEMLNTAMSTLSD